MCWLDAVLKGYMPASVALCETLAGENGLVLSYSLGVGGIS